ncbi:glycosyltransferase family 4 protein [Williamsia serinedens]|uniref:Glycosyltransferase involved in cell wall bisynthesis n=1 Tax=Williamsia serinedens TaxID=391736 RepID=A0ABT1H5P8_9NOCA|nr:glycosyltransferase family 4 protein [Williamsia serinedens]MCP2161913.1 Glycosyltransferase involved in cell wall bisynthesis [Williamsia serinedens]
MRTVTNRAGEGSFTDNAEPQSGAQKIRSILFVGLNYKPEPTGIAVYTTDAAEGLAALGHRVTVITGYPHYPQWHMDRPYLFGRRDERVHGVRVIRVKHPVPGRPTLLHRAFMEVVFGVRSVRAIASARDNYDAVICVSPALLASAIVVAWFRRRRHRPAVGLWVQDLYSRAAVETGGVAVRAAAWVFALELRLLHAVDSVAVIHQRFSTHVVDAMGVPMRRTTTIRNWCHSAPRPEMTRTEARASLGWDQWQGAIAVHAGNMGVKQNLDAIVDAAREATRIGADITFVLIGDGNQRTRLENSARGMKNVVFMDPMGESDFRAALRGADVLLVSELQSLREMSLPSKLTSYFQSGTPVVAATPSDSITASEMAESGAGLRVEPDAPLAIVEAIRHLADDTEFAKRCAEAAMRHVDHVLGRDTAMTVLQHWIESLAGRDASVVAAAR